MGRGGGLHFRHRRGMRTEAVTAMHQRHRLRLVAQLRAPIKRRVAATDDEHIAIAIRFRGGDQRVDAAAVPFRCERLRQLARAEGADAGGDHDRARWEPIGFRDQHEVAVFFLEADHALPQMRRDARLLMELSGLLREIPDEIFRQHARVACHVEDVLLRVQRRELTAKLRERIDDLGRRAAHAGVKQGEQARGAAADDGEVANGMGRHAPKIMAK